MIGKSPHNIDAADLIPSYRVVVKFFLTVASCTDREAGLVPPSGDYKHRYA